MIKKIKKSQSLLSIHLSHTYPIKIDPAIKIYIDTKLNSTNNIVPISQIEEKKIKQKFEYSKPEDIPKKINWKY